MSSVVLPMSHQKSVQLSFLVVSIHPIPMERDGMYVLFFLVLVIPPFQIPLPPLPRSLPSPSASSSSSISPPNVLKVLQITDIHIDFHYESGSEAECADPVCCRGKNSRNWASESRFVTSSTVFFTRRWYFNYWRGREQLQIHQYRQDSGERLESVIFPIEQWRTCWNISVTLNM